MSSSKQLAQVPKGITCPGVNRSIIKYLLDENIAVDGKNWLDVPCGDGDLLNSIVHFFPSTNAFGADLEIPPHLSKDRFTTVDASQPFKIFAGTTFDCISSVSGVMEFDNTLQYFRTCFEHLRDGGLLVVTNDNFIATMDRLYFLMLGKSRRYRVWSPLGNPTWKVMSLNNLVRVLEEAGFRVHTIRYVSSNWKDWVTLPLSLLLYCIQTPILRMASKNPLSRVERQMYPFASLISRHYVVYCEKPQVST